jgi:exonuclease VII small subunit
VWDFPTAFTQRHFLSLAVSKMNLEDRIDALEALVSQLQQQIVNLEAIARQEQARRIAEQARRIVAERELERLRNPNEPVNATDILRLSSVQSTCGSFQSRL